MDAIAWTEVLFADLAEGRDVAGRLAPDFQADIYGATVAGDALWEWARRQRDKDDGRGLRLLDTAWKRNLVFASYEWTDPAGDEGERGTAALAWDRDGRLLSWTQIA